MQKKDPQFDTQSLKKRIALFKERYRGASEKPLGNLAATGKATRLGIELISGVLIGLALGILIDHWAGSSPWGLILGFLLGSLAGFLNIYHFLTHQKR